MAGACVVVDAGACSVVVAGACVVVDDGAGVGYRERRRTVKGAKMQTDSGTGEDGKGE